MDKSLLMAYCWLKVFSYEQAIKECRFGEEHVSNETVTYWNSYSREVSMISLDAHYQIQGRNGGTGHVV